jgi:MFS family permease
MFFFMTQFLQGIRGMSALVTGFAFLPLAAVLFAMTRVVPHLLPRLGPRPLAVTGSLLLCAGLVWLTRLSTTSEYPVAVLGPMVLLGLGAGLGFIPLTAVIMATVDPRDAGAAGGVFQTMQQVGSTLGLAALVTVFGTSVRHATPPGTPTTGHALVAGMTHAFAVSALLTAATVLVALTFRRSQPHRHTGSGGGQCSAVGHEPMVLTFADRFMSCCRAIVDHGFARLGRHSLGSPDRA